MFTFSSSVVHPVGLNLFKNSNFYPLIIRAVQNLLIAESRQELKLYAKTTANWKGKPDFSYRLGTEGDAIFVEVGTDDKVYKFLDKGTKVRRAKMSPDFTPKTMPGSLSSGRGSGERLYVNRKLSLPGIQPRRFTNQIYDIRRPIMMYNFRHYIIPYAVDLLRGKAGAPPNRYWR